MPMPGNALANLRTAQKQLIQAIQIAMLGFRKGICVQRQLAQLNKNMILLLDELYSLPKTDDRAAFYTGAHPLLVELLEVLHHCHPHSFDAALPAPLYLQEEARAGFDHQIPLLKAGLNRNKINPDLREIILYPFLHFGSKGHNSYGQIKCLQKLATMLLSRFEGKCSDNDSLADLLAMEGFNTKAFLRYYEQKMKQVIKTHHQELQQLEVLYDDEQRFRLMPKHAALHYDPRNTTVKTRLLKFVQTRIDCLRKKQKLYAPRVHTKAETKAPPAYRLKTNLSVDGLACLLRLLIEAGALEANPRTQLMAFVAANVETKGKPGEFISVESLLTKYKHTNQSTAIGVKSLLTKMTRQVQERFNL